MTTCEKNKGFFHKTPRCTTPIHEDWKYCKEHGCKNCKGVVRKTAGGVEIEDKFWACGESCKKELVAKECKRREIDFINFNDKMIDKLKAIWNNTFFTDLKELIDELTTNKLLAIYFNDKTSAPIITLASDLTTFEALINNNKTLNHQEKEDLKKLYNENKDEDIDDLSKKEETFLSKLITERKKNFERKQRDKDDNDRDRDNPKPLPNPQDDVPKPKKNPLPLPDEPSDQPQELNEIKQRIKDTHNLTEEEFKAIIGPLTDQDLLEHVSSLLSKVKEVQSGDADVNSCLEFLISHRDAPDDLMKKKAYKAVNSYEQWVDEAITTLHNKKQIINASLEELVRSEDEEKLNLIYDKAKQDTETYQENQEIIDNHKQRTSEAIKIESQPNSTWLEKELAAKLRTIINSNSEKSVLENLEKELNELKLATEGERKTAYNNHSETIDLMLKEIKSELTRREPSQKDQRQTPSNKKTLNNSKEIPTLLVIIMLAPLGIVLFSIAVLKYRKNKLKVQKN